MVMISLIVSDIDDDNEKDDDDYGDNDNDDNNNLHNKLDFDWLLSMIYWRTGA